MKLPALGGHALITASSRNPGWWVCSHPSVEWPAGPLNYHPNPGDLDRPEGGWAGPVRPHRTALQGCQSPSKNGLHEFHRVVHTGHRGHFLLDRLSRRTEALLTEESIDCVTDPLRRQVARSDMREGLALGEMGRQR